MTAPTLVLAPTEFEAKILRDIPDSPPGVEICGFGLAASAARTAQLLAARQPATVILLGIAGALDPQLEPGTALRLGAVGCYGIGAGTGADHQTAAEMGWTHWSANGSLSIGDRIVFDAQHHAELLTVCAAASCQDDVSQRRQKFPQAVAEDMEGFGVALACVLANCNLKIYRGISNQAGDRDTANWKIRAALQATVTLYREDYPHRS